MRVGVFEGVTDASRVRVVNVSLEAESGVLVIQLLQQRTSRSLDRYTSRLESEMPLARALAEEGEGVVDVFSSEDNVIKSGTAVDIGRSEVDGYDVTVHLDWNIVANLSKMVPCLRVQ